MLRERLSLEKLDAIITRPMAPFLLAVLLALTPTAARDEKTDIVTLENGDRIVGEIKSMSRGNLRYKTDSAGTITIEWDEILKLTSEHRFRLELLDGTRLVGIFLDPPQERTLLLRKDDGTQLVLPMTDIARLTEFDKSALERIDLYVNTGFSFTKASDVTQYTFGSGLSYYDRERSVSLDLSAIITDQENEDTAQRVDFLSSYRRLLSRRWFTVGFLTMNHNTELALDLRTTVGAGPGRFLVQSQSQELSAFAGLAYSYEVPDGESSDTKWEGVIGSTYDIFITDTPETLLSFNGTFFPGITETDRRRANLNFKLKKEFVEDLYWEISYYLDYDSEPSSDDGETTDYGIVTGLTYTF